MMNEATKSVSKSIRERVEESLTELKNSLSVMFGQVKRL